MNNEVNRQGSVALTWTDTSKALKILILTKRPELMYEYFASKGDRYALLANSVVKGDSFSGKFALNYLEEVIIENGQICNETKLEKIRFDMAYAYIYEQRSRLKNGVTEITGDINYKEAMAFHERVFKK